jgi:hypothetical protein
MLFDSPSSAGWCYQARTNTHDFNLICKSASKATYKAGLSFVAKAISECCVRVGLGPGDDRVLWVAKELVEFSPEQIREHRKRQAAEAKRQAEQRAKGKAEGRAGKPRNSRRGRASPGEVQGSL